MSVCWPDVGVVVQMGRTLWLKYVSDERCRWDESVCQLSQCDLVLPLGCRFPSKHPKQMNIILHRLHCLWKNRLQTCYIFNQEFLSDLGYVTVPQKSLIPFANMISVNCFSWVLSVFQSIGENGASCHIQIQEYFYKCPNEGAVRLLFLQIVF